AAVPEAGQESAINKTNMDTAVSIMERRVNGLGVSEAEVQTQGTRNIIVNIPKGTNSEQAREQVGTTAKLYFRPVLQRDQSGAAADGDQAASPPPTDGATSQGRAVTEALKADPTPGASASASASPSASGSGKDDGGLEAQYAALDCTKPAQRVDAGKGVKPTEGTVACGQDSAGQWQRYLLGPAEVERGDVDKAEAVYDTQGGAGWKVTLGFTDSGSKKFAAITGKLAQKQSPQNEFAIVLDGNVVSNPYVRQSLSGSAEISGNFKQEEAKNLANILSYGSLPLSFREDSVTTVTAALGGEQLQAGLSAGADRKRVVYA